MHKQYIFKDTINQLATPETFKNICHEHHEGESMPSSEQLGHIVEKLREIIFPGYFGNIKLEQAKMPYYLGVYVNEVFDLLSEQVLAGLCFACQTPESRDISAYSEKAKNIASEFITQLPTIRQQLVNDVKAAYEGDPAAISYGEVIYCYPAIRAISSYRIAHALLQLEVPIIPRMISEMAHSETGIDIHPSAKIGESFTIDHGTGVVVGSTSIIGNNVKLYQGVTLGAKSFPLDENGNPIKGIARHPIVEDNVIVYSQATILGRITIGANSVIGGNVWLTESVPANSRIIQRKAKETQYSDGGGI
ncbi:serine acetyltransferase [Prolixibacteraceae bacterium JC049]|nr:serine acetyltransferase [Prolixibacteraceae bacterium JC049]